MRVIGSLAFACTGVGDNGVTRSPAITLKCEPRGYSEFLSEAEAAPCSELANLGVPTPQGAVVLFLNLP